MKAVKFEGVLAITPDPLDPQGFALMGCVLPGILVLLGQRVKFM